MQTIADYCRLFADYLQTICLTIYDYNELEIVFNVRFIISHLLKVLKDEIIIEYVTTRNNNKRYNMVNYANGKIYKIESINATEGDPDIYIGSTTKFYLSERMVLHRRDYIEYEKGNSKVGKITSFDIFDKFGVENCRIVLLDIFPCTSRDELTSRESYFIRNLKCVNKIIPNRTKEEYRLEHRDHLLQKGRDYYVANIDTIKIRKTTPTLCVCGCTVSKSNLPKHIKSKKHIDLIFEMNSISDSIPTESL